MGVCLCEINFKRCRLIILLFFMYENYPYFNNYMCKTSNALLSVIAKKTKKIFEGKCKRKKNNKTKQCNGSLCMLTNKYLT